MNPLITIAWGAKSENISTRISSKFSSVKFRDASGIIKFETLIIDEAGANKKLKSLKI